MSRAINKAVVLRYFQELVNKHDSTHIEEIFAPEFIEYGANAGLPPGPEASRQYGRFMQKIFPDVFDRIEAIVVTDTKVAVRVIGIGTHSSQHFGVPATGKQLAWTATMIWTIVDGRFTERWMAFDTLSQMIQLGVVPPVKQVIVPDPHRALLPDEWQEQPGEQSVTTSEELLSPLRRSLEALTGGNLAIIDDVVAPDYIDHGGWIDGLPAGNAGLKQEIAILRHAFPDLTITLEDSIAAEGYAALRLAATGTHRGEFLGISATNRAITWISIGIYKVVNGKIKERWTDVSRQQIYEALL